MTLLKHNIQAVVFDLDGTLVKTEQLKARSYAQAAIDLCPYAITEQDVLTAFKDFVGLSRYDVAKGLMERFSLQDKARARMKEFGVTSPWQAYVQLRLQHYNTMLADETLIKNNCWPHTMHLLEFLRQSDVKLGLATMSYCEQATRVLAALGLTGVFASVVTRDDVEHGKPDPEMYTLIAKELEVPAGRMLVIEDSAAGVMAALAANAAVIAVATPFTKEALLSLPALPAGHLVLDASTLMDVAKRALAAPVVTD